MQSFGKAEELKDPKRGRNYREFLGEKVEPQTEVKQNKDGIAIIAKSVVADEMTYNLKKMYKRNADGSVSFFYAFKGSINNSTMAELNLIADLIKAAFENDFERCFMACNASIVRSLTVRVSFERQLMYLYFVLSFEKPWEPDETFEEMA